MIIKLVRHGQSQSNTGQVDATHVGDHSVSLTPTGKRQAELAGQRIYAEHPEFLNGPKTLRYRSPFVRTRETMDKILSVAHPDGSYPKIYEDLRLREVEWGYNKDKGDYVDEMRTIHGKVFYRMEGGESPADCFDRISTFLETLMRQVERKQANRVLIVSHGLTIRCFVMRFMHLTVEEFDEIRNPKNCDIITIRNEGPLEGSQFTSGRWGIQGLRLPGRKDPGHRAYPWHCPECKEYDVWPH